MSTDPILSGRDVTKSFDGLTAVDVVDFEILPGEVVGLIGPNGSGKTTLFNCITGALSVDVGTINFRGQDITSWEEYRIAQAGLVRMFQEVRVYGGMTVYENVLFSVDHSQETTVDVFRRYPEDVYDRADDLLKYVDLWRLRENEASDLSYGQQKLLEFAMTLMVDPDVILLDEPAGGINPTMIRQVLEYIRDANENRDKTLFIIEHNMDVIMDISDRIYVMSSGRTLAEGDPETIQTDERVKDAYLGGR